MNELRFAFRQLLKNPVGKRIRPGGPNTPWITVLGVARDVKHYGLDQPVIPGVYLPFAQDPQAHMSLVVRSSVAPTSLVPSIQALVRERDPELPVSGVVTMEERLRQSLVAVLACWIPARRAMKVDPVEARRWE